MLLLVVLLALVPASGSGDDVDGTDGTTTDIDGEMDVDKEEEGGYVFRVTGVASPQGSCEEEDDVEEDEDEDEEDRVNEPSCWHGSEYGGA